MGVRRAPSTTLPVPWQTSAGLAPTLSYIWLLTPGYNCCFRYMTHPDMVSPSEKDLNCDSV